MECIYIIIIILLILLIFIIYNNYYIKKICNNLEYFIYGEKTPNNKTILILGGIHGDEPAGSRAILQLMNDINTNINIKNIKLNNRLILIPHVNYCALQINKRSIPLIGDLNRKFPSSENYNENKLHPIIKQILKFTKEADFIIDFHEGWGYYKENNESIGSTITPTNTIISNQVADLVYNNLNKNITEDNKKFTILTNNTNLIQNTSGKYGKNIDIKNTFKYYANIINKNYILIETSGQNDIQELDIRINQARNIIDTILNYYNFI
jgi:hypothetical protein